MYSYRHGFSGFAAKLTESEAEKIAGIVNMSSSISINISTSWSVCICVYKIRLLCFRAAWCCSSHTEQPSPSANY